MALRNLWRLLKSTVSEWSLDQASLMAAALAYFTVFSLAPLMVLVIQIAGFFFGEQAAEGELVGQLQSLLGENGAQLIQTAIANERLGNEEGTFDTAINLGLLLFGATAVFTQLQKALNQIWDVKPRPGTGIRYFLQKRLLSFSMILVVAFLLLVSLVFSTTMGMLSNALQGSIPGLGYLWQLGSFLIPFGVVTILFASVYKFLPDARITWSDVWVGAVTTAVLFEIGKAVISFYFRQSDFGSAYGAAGSLVIILTWVFYSAQILFFGAEFTQVYARRHGKQIVPAPHAMRVHPDDNYHKSTRSPQDKPQNHSRSN